MVMLFQINLCIMNVNLTRVDEKLDLSTILSHASKVKNQFKKPLISILELFEKRNNGEENIYVLAPIEILSSEPIYDEYSDELEERPFESVFTEIFSN